MSKSNKNTNTKSNKGYDKGLTLVKLGVMVITALTGTNAIANTYNTVYNANKYNVVNNTVINNSITNNVTNNISTNISNTVIVVKPSVSVNTVKPNTVVKKDIKPDFSFYEQIEQRIADKPNVRPLPKPIYTTYTPREQAIPSTMDLTQYKQCKRITVEENVVGDSIGHGVRLTNKLEGNTSVGMTIDGLISTVRTIPKRVHGSNDCIYRVTYVSIGTNDYYKRYTATAYNDKLAKLEGALQSTINPNRIVYLINSNTRYDIVSGTRGVIEALQHGRQFIMLPKHNKEVDTIHYTQYGYSVIYKESINNYLNSVDIKK